MSETVTSETTPIPAAPTYKMTIEETVKTLQSYDAQAESSLKQLQTNIDNATNQINEWRRIQLMIVGQRQLVQDLISKTVDAPVVAPATTETAPAVS